jgi:hypothetical protein
LSNLLINTSANIPTYVSLNKQIITEEMRWAGHVARMGRREVYGVLVGKPEERDHLEDPGIYGRITL